MIDNSNWVLDITFFPCYNSIIRCAVGVLVNGILLGPMRGLLSSVLAETGTLSEATIQNSRDICEEAASEGIILTKNDGTLPLTGITNLNVFGWASTNPVYGGTSSGTVDASAAIAGLVRHCGRRGVLCQLCGRHLCRLPLL